MNYLTHQLLDSEELKILEKILIEKNYYGKMVSKLQGSMPLRSKIIYNLEEIQIYQLSFWIDHKKDP